MWIRKLKNGDVAILEEFGKYLSQRSKELFCPYPWDDQSLLKQRLEEAISSSLQGIDASFIGMNERGKVISHFFLWKAGGNPYSQKFGVEVPELGVAVADSHQGKGIGYQCVRFLQNLAQKKKRDAIELTTALDNSGGWHTYLKAEFEYVGDILNPLEVNATEFTEGRIATTKFRKERQMVWVANKDRREEILEYLAFKRQPK